MSKFEFIIAKLLDEMGINFQYGPKKFLQEYHLIPDFKLYINNKVYYWEHLGNMSNISYRERWYRKLKACKKIA